MDHTIMADQLTNERRSPGRRTITIKEATRAFRAALGDTEKPDLIEAPAETTLVQHPRGGYVIKPSGKMTAKSSARRSSGRKASSKTPTRKPKGPGANKQPAKKSTGPSRSRE